MIPPFSPFTAAQSITSALSSTSTAPQNLPAISTHEERIAEIQRLRAEIQRLTNENQRYQDLLDSEMDTSEHLLAFGNSQEQDEMDMNIDEDTANDMLAIGQTLETNSSRTSALRTTTYDEAFPPPAWWSNEELIDAPPYEQD